MSVLQSQGSIYQCPGILHGQVVQYRIWETPKSFHSDIILVSIDFCIARLLFRLSLPDGLYIFMLLTNFLLENLLRGRIHKLYPPLCHLI